MRNEGKGREKQTNTNYWLEALLGWGLGDVVYLIVKLAKKEKPTVGGLVSSGIAGGIGTPLAVWGIPKVVEMERRAQGSYSFRPAAVPSPSPTRVNAAPMPKITPQVEKHSPSVPVVPVGQELKQSTSEEYPWVDILPQGSVTLILGKPGSGKSALGYFLLERLHYQTRCYVVSLPNVAHPHLPPWLGVVDSLEEAPLDAALLVDEGALQFSARMSTSEKNRRLLGAISLARQRNQIIIFVSQEASYIDINIVRGLSTLIVKEPAPLQVALERAELKEFVQKAQEEFQKVEDDRRGWAYIAFSPCGYQGMVEVTKPSFFSDALSKCYAFPHEETKEKQAQALSKEEKKKKAYEWYTKEHLSVRKIAPRLGVSKSTVWNWIKEEKDIRRKAHEFITGLLSGLGQTGKK